MRVAFLTLLLAAATSATVFAGTAAASGPPAPGKELIDLTCEGFDQPITVSVARGDDNNGAGQIVGMQGHGIPVSFTFTITDETTGDVVDSETGQVGGGHAHPNQATTACSGTLFEGAASDFFGDELPPDVSADDTIVVTIDVLVILKP
jgi:hypothetical protein